MILDPKIPIMIDIGFATRHEEYCRSTIGNQKDWGSRDAHARATSPLHRLLDEEANVASLKYPAGRSSLIQLSLNGRIQNQIGGIFFS